MINTGVIDDPDEEEEELSEESLNSEDSLNAETIMKEKSPVPMSPMRKKSLLTNTQMADFMAMHTIKAEVG